MYIMYINEYNNQTNWLKSLNDKTNNTKTELILCISNLSIVLNMISGGGVPLCGPYLSHGTTASRKQ